RLARSRRAVCCDDGRRRLRAPLHRESAPEGPAARRDAARRRPHDPNRRLHARAGGHCPGGWRRAASRSPGIQPLPMIHLTRKLVRRWLDSLLHVNDTPHRTAMAYAMGVFLGFSPFLGLHTIIGLVLAFLLNLNRVAVLLGVYSNLPWIMGGYYAFTTAVGAVMMQET